MNRFVLVNVKGHIESRHKMLSSSSSGDWTNPNFYIEVERDYARDPNGIRFVTNFPPELKGSVNVELISFLLKLV